ncbi:hypothetical protein AKJ16_DCAP11385 [Drosera capensis]
MYLESPASVGAGGESAEGVMRRRGRFNCSGVSAVGDSRVPAIEGSVRAMALAVPQCCVYLDVLCLWAFYGRWRLSVRFLEVITVPPTRYIISINKSSDRERIGVRAIHVPRHPDGAQLQKPARFRFFSDNPIKATLFEVSWIELFGNLISSFNIKDKASSL